MRRMLFTVCLLWASAVAAQYEPATPPAPDDEVEVPMPGDAADIPMPGAASDIVPPGGDAFGSTGASSASFISGALAVLAKAELRGYAEDTFNLEYRPQRWLPKCRNCSLTSPTYWDFNRRWEFGIR